jgi:hypothetical protein
MIFRIITLNVRSDHEWCNWHHGQWGVFQRAGWLAAQSARSRCSPDWFTCSGCHEGASRTATHEEVCCEFASATRFMRSLRRTLFRSARDRLDRMSRGPRWRVPTVSTTRWMTGRTARSRARHRLGLTLVRQGSVMRSLASIVGQYGIRQPGRLTGAWILQSSPSWRPQVHARPKGRW